MLDVVALLADRMAEGLGRGQVGTVVESLGDNTVLVEFSDMKAARTPSRPARTQTFSFSITRLRPL